MDVGGFICKIKEGKKYRPRKEGRKEGMMVGLVEGRKDKWMDEGRKEG